MHTGTLITELISTVERAELRGGYSAARNSEQRPIFDKWELNRIYGLQSTTDQQEAFRGAA